MKRYLFVVFLFSWKVVFSQLTEGFTDGDFNSDPVWIGSNTSTDFIVTSNKLRSNASTASSNFYLSTTNSLANGCVWEFYCNIQFNPSGLNYVDVYLVSDQADLQSANINGYYVRIGNTDDEISLYKRAGAKSSSVKIIDGINGILNTSNTAVKVRVTRTASNEFTLERDLSGTGSSYLSEGSVTDSQITASTHFGIFIQQSTASFFQKHFFDDIRISPIIVDTDPPVLVSATAIDSLTVEAVFNEGLDSATAKNNANFMLTGLNNPASVTLVSTSKYRLHYNTSLQTSPYTLTVSNVKDLQGNIIGVNNSAQFNFIKPYVVKKNDIAINEIFADPGPQVDLPGLEFIELWNTTDKIIHLNNWKYSDPSTSYTFGNDSLQASEYLILCARADTLEFKRFGRVLGISPWPSLNNAGDVIKLVSDKNITISEISYSDSWYKDAIKKLGGYTMERIDPSSKCEGLFNWLASADINGGTPGKINTVHQQNYDSLQFKADSLKQTSDTTLKVWFNKPIDQATLTPDKFLLNPAFASVKTLVLSADAVQLTITYPQKFTSGTPFDLAIQFLRDCSGNIISGLNQPLEFLTASPPPVRLDTATIYITELFPDPSPEIGLPLAEFVEIYNPGNDTVDLEGWTLRDATTTTTIGNSSILPKQYIILCPAADTTHYKTFGKVIGLSPWPSFTNTSDQVILRSFKDRMVDSVAYNDAWYKDAKKKSGGWTLERIDPLSQCRGSSAWSASKDTTGGTPGKVNSIHIKDYDLLDFHTDSLKRTSDSTVIVYFNKVIDQTSVTPNKFTLSPGSGSANTVLNPELDRITLTFSQKFSPGTTYSLTIHSVQDCSGKALSNVNQPLKFTLPALPPPPPVRPDTATIFITEIFADPSPEVGLPLAEFVEIYNPGNDTIDLEGWTLRDATTTTTFGKNAILPKQYIILCPAADTTQYKAFGKVIGLSPWPSFTNTSDQVILRSFKDRTVDSVAYNDTWYKDVQKKSGGWTLERIDPLSQCRGSSGWNSSKDTTGGTPGKVNSIYIKDYDHLDFHTDSLKRTSDSTLIVYFNKAIDPSSLSPEKFTLSPASGSANTVLNTELNRITLTFNQEFSPETTYSLTVQSVQDCSGKIISNINLPLKFTTPTIPPPPPIRLDTATIFITEIFADPSPEIGLPLAEFVEIYNPGNDTIDLEDWTLRDATTTTTIGNNSILPKQYTILCPAADTTQYKSFGKVIGLSPWPSFTNTSDQVILRSFKDRTVDSVAYNDTWYKDVQKKSGGWTLERIDPLSQCRGSSGWNSSKDTTGGTPGKVNSIYIKDYDLLDFHADSLKRTSDSTVMVYFNKVIDQASVTPNKFTLFPASGSANTVLNPELDRITLTFSQKFSPGTTYSLTIHSVQECSGKALSNVNQPLKFTLPALPPPPPVRPDTATIFITEIFADPSPEVGLPLAEFVEIYNPGNDTIDLEGWTLRDATTTTTFGKNAILPKQYIILCPAADTLQYKTFGKTIGLSPWPGFNNSSDQVQLKSFKNRIVDSVGYRDTWYKDTKKESGGWSLERIDPTSFNEWYNWSASSHTSGGTPGQVNSVNNPGWRNTALKIDSVRILSDSTLRVHFNVIQDTLFLKPSNFRVNGHPAVSIKVAEDFHFADLQFKDHFIEEKTYTLVAENLRTFSGSVISFPNNQGNFSIQTSPELRYPIVINEIFSDTSPVVGLPDGEFIELFNPTDQMVPLKGLSYEDGTTKYHFTSGNIEAGGYLILCPLKDTLNYKPFARTYGLHPWPNLNNDKDILIFRNNKGTEIHRVSYENSWHQNKDKQSGGWSLELIDPGAVCSGKQNWASSKEVSGGSPGKVNSVYKTHTTIEPLKLLTATLSDSTTLLLSFSRTIDSLSSSLITRYLVNNGVGKPVNALVVGPDFTQVMLNFPDQIARGNTYAITVEGVTDCAGKIIDANHRSAEFFFPERIKKGDILINEILFNPRPNGADFIEIYNNSKNELDLKDLAIATIKDSLTSVKPLTANSLFFMPGKYLVLTTDPDNIRKEYITENPDAFLKLPSLPSFNDDAGTVVLVSNGIIIDELSYTDKMHDKVIEAPEGVSLERSSFKKPSMETGNFRSAAGSKGYATPGYKNSQFLEDVEMEEELFLSSKTFSPDNDGFEDVLQVNYKFKEPGLIANATIYNDRGVLIKRLTKNLSLAANGTIYWDGQTEFNEKASTGIYVLFMETFDLKGQVKKYKRSFAVAANLN